MVGYSGRLISDVAPNSPKEIVKAKTEETTVDLARIGRSICIHTLHGGAPRIEAASRRDLGIDATAG